MTTTQKIHLSLKASNLANIAKGRRKKSHPYAVVSVALSSSANAERKVLGQTEVVQKNLNPDWVKTFTIVHDPDKIYFVTVEVKDMGSEDKSMGSATFQLPSILASRGNTKSFNMLNNGSLSVRAEEAIGTGTLVLKMSGRKLKNTEGFCRKSDPFYEFVRSDTGEHGNEFNVVHRSQPITSDLNPDWPEERISLSKLCQGNIDRPLQLSIYDWEKSGKHVLMGGIETTVADLLSKFENENLSIDLQCNRKVSGKLILHWVKVVNEDAD